MGGVHVSVERIGESRGRTISPPLWKGGRGRESGRESGGIERESPALYGSMEGRGGHGVLDRRRGRQNTWEKLLDLESGRAGAHGARCRGNFGGAGVLDIGVQKWQNSGMRARASHP